MKLYYCKITTLFGKINPFYSKKKKGTTYECDYTWLIIQIQKLLAINKKNTNFTLIDFFFFLIFGSSYLHFFFEGKLPTSKLIRTRTFGSFVSIWYVQVSLAVFAHLWPIPADQIINYTKITVISSLFSL